MMEDFDQFPAEAIHLANNSSYPVILLSDKFAYANVIRTITEAIYLSEAGTVLEAAEGRQPAL